MISTKANAEMSLFLGSGLGKFVGLRGLHSGTRWKYGHLVRLCQRWLAKSHQTSSRDAGISRGSYKTAGLSAVKQNGPFPMLHFHRSGTQLAQSNRPHLQFSCVLPPKGF